MSEGQGQGGRLWKHKATVTSAFKFAPWAAGQDITGPRGSRERGQDGDGSSVGNPDISVEGPPEARRRRWQGTGARSVQAAGGRVQGAGAESWAPFWGADWRLRTCWCCLRPRKHLLELKPQPGT